MNYFDKFADQFGTYSDYLSKRQIDTTAPTIKVYLLDRERGPKGEIYNEQVNRVYLPFYTIRGLYLTQDWTQPLGKNAVTMPDVDVTTIILNLNDMIQKQRQLKNTHHSELYISYSGTLTASVEKHDNRLIIKEDCNILYDIDLTKYCMQELSDYIHSLIKFDSRVDGQLTEAATNLLDFEPTIFNTTEEVMAYTLNNIYTTKTINDFIQAGDLIITHHNVLYEVVDYYVVNLRMNTWTNYLIKCEKRDLSDQIKLPNDGIKEITENWLLLGKYDWARK